MESIAKNALAIALGVLIAGAVGWGVRLYFMSAMLEAGTGAMQEFQAAQQEKIRAQKEKARLAKLREEAERRRLADQERRQKEFEAARRKAFLEWYKVPGGCGPNGNKSIVECANDKMRARREFYASWERKNKAPKFIERGAITLAQ